MIRRSLWVTAGAVAGVAGTVWSRRRVKDLADRARQGQLPGDVVRLVDRGSRRVARRVGTAVDAGRVEARRRESELRLAVRPRTYFH